MSEAEKLQRNAWELEAPFQVGEIPTPFTTIVLYIYKCFQHKDYTSTLTAQVGKWKPMGQVGLELRSWTPHQINTIQS